MSDQGRAARALSSNHAIEAAAIEWVMSLERAEGREPADRRYEAAFPADLESGDRVIEVKAVGGDQRQYGFLWLEAVQVEEARRNPNFWLYIVDNVRQGDPASFRLKVLGPHQLAELLPRARERRYFELPVPVRAFDAALGLEGLKESSGQSQT